MKGNERSKIEERECVLAEEIAAKKLKLNQVGEQISDISFAEEFPKCVDSSTQTEELDFFSNYLRLHPSQFSLSLLKEN